jgi:acetylornithine deacetylase
MGIRGSMNGHGGRTDGRSARPWAAVDAAIQDGAPLADAMAQAHAAAHGTPPRRAVLGATTDARFYINQFGRPALCYGPTARNIYAVDEAVDLASIVSGARTLARFMAGFFAAGLPAGDAQP